MIPTGLVTLNNHVLASLDVETTGSLVGYHDLIQVAALPLDSNMEGVGRPFYMNIKPDHPERAQKDAFKKHGLKMEDLLRCPNKWEVADAFDEWFRSLNLPFAKKLVPLTQNGSFDIPFVKHWLGNEAFNRYFAFPGRDTMYAAAYINDQLAWKCRPTIFSRTGLATLCSTLGIPLDSHHDALADVIATAAVYRELLRLET